MLAFIVWTPLNEEQCSLRSVYSNDYAQRKIKAYIRNCGGKTIAGKLQSGGREREQERKEKE
jgi:hypothetical protein